MKLEVGSLCGNAGFDALWNWCAPSLSYGARAHGAQAGQPGGPPILVGGGLERRTAETGRPEALATRETRLTQYSCFILATNELDEQRLSPQELLTGYKGQSHTERGFRFLKAPQFLAASLYRKKPEHIMALLMVMTVCLLVYAALEYRIRKALVDHGRRFPTKRANQSRTPQRAGSSTIS